MLQAAWDQKQTGRLRETDGALATAPTQPGALVLLDL